MSSFLQNGRKWKINLRSYFPCHILLSLSYSWEDANPLPLFQFKSFDLQNSFVLKLLANLTTFKGPLFHPQTAAQNPFLLPHFPFVMAISDLVPQSPFQSLFQNNDFTICWKAEAEKATNKSFTLMVQRAHQQGFK